MSSETLLSDLCAICHVNAIKYTCPRCGIHTCCLPCVKKHKAWAQCSGIRNPAEYRKRKDLETPSSIDKDFNFITNVERSLVRADNDVLGRGIHLAPARTLRPVDQKPKIDAKIQEQGIKVIRAPKGLSRAKQNKTHWVNQQKCIMWTMEWVCADGERISGAALETRSIADAYIFTVGKKKVKQKRRLSQRDAAQASMLPSKAIKLEEQGIEPTQRLMRGPRHDSSFNANSAADEQNQSGQNDTAAPYDGLLEGIYFYLHNPNAPGKVKCLVSLSSDQTVAGALKDQTVLEFPTFYAKHESPDQLKEPFISQENYERQYGGDTLTSITMPLEDGQIDDENEPASNTGVDAQKVIEVLARDLAAG